MTALNGSNKLVAFDSIAEVDDDEIYQSYAENTKSKLTQMKEKALSLLNNKTQLSVDTYITPIGDKGYKGVFNFVELDYPNGTEVPNVKVIQVEIKEFYLS